MTTRAELLDRVRDGLGDALLAERDRGERRAYLDIPPQAVPSATRLMFSDLGARLQIASGVDTPTAIEILYHWAFDAADLVVTLRTHVPRDRPEIDSIAPICKAAEWIEREMWELLGITFRGHPDLRHLLLDDDWPEGSYPLRRDYVRPASGAAKPDGTTEEPEE